RKRALEAYFAWVAAGRRLDVIERILALAETRLTQVRGRAAEGAIAPVDAIEAEHAVFVRREMRLGAQRALEASALRLGLFVRDDAGSPAPPSPGALPSDLELPPPIQAGQALRDRVLDCHPILGAARA